MTNEELAAELERLNEKATPGEWYPDGVDEATKDDLALCCFYRNHHAAIVSALRDVARMRAELDGGMFVPISEWNITIAERDALKAALQPFADACARADASSEEVRRAGMGTGHSDDASPGWGIRYRHLKAARSALEPAR